MAMAWKKVGRTWKRVSDQKDWIGCPVRNRATGKITARVVRDGGNRGDIDGLPSNCLHPVVRVSGKTAADAKQHVIAAYNAYYRTQVR